MAEFDPTVIADIPDLANPNRAKAQRLTIADMVDQGQMNQLKLSAERTKQADQAKTKEVLKNAKYGTPEDMVKTAESLTRAGLPDQAMDFMQHAQRFQSGEIENQKAQYEILGQQNEIMANAASQILSEYDSMIQKGVPPQQAVAMMQPKYQAAIQQLMQAKLPNGQPAVPPQVLQAIQQEGGMFNPEALKGFAMNSKRVQEALKLHLAERAQGTRDESEAEKERHNRAMEDKGGTQRIPSGFEADPAKPGELRPIPGGPKDPKTATLSGREGVFFGRVVSSANEAVAAIKNIVELPVGASSGVLGVGGGPGHGLFASGKAALTNQMASQDVQDYNTMLAGVKRNLATIESAGLAPSGSLTENFASLELRAGDTEMTKLRKLAEMRQVVEKGMEVNLDNPRLPAEQKALVAKIIDQVKEAVPYTQSDVTRLQRAQKDNPATTLQELMGKQGLGAEGGLPQGVTEDDIAETMRVRGMTREQVLEKLKTRAR